MLSNGDRYGCSLTFRHSLEVFSERADQPALISPAFTPVVAFGVTFYVNVTTT